MPKTELAFAAMLEQPERSIEKVFVGNIVRTSPNAQLLVYAVKDVDVTCLVIRGQLQCPGGLSYPMGMAVVLSRYALIDRVRGPHSISIAG